MRGAIQWDGAVVSSRSCVRARGRQESGGILPVACAATLLWVAAHCAWQLVLCYNLVAADAEGAT